MDRNRPQPSADEYAERQRALTAVVDEITRGDDDPAAALRRLAEAAADVLEADRVQIRLLSEDRSLLRTAVAYDRASGDFGAPADASLTSEPAIEAVVEGRAPLAELTSPGPSSRLDVPVTKEGALRGIVTFEYAPGPRTWYPAEQQLAASVGQLVGMAEAVRRRRQSERVARQRERVQEALVEAAHDFVFVLERDGTVSYVNRFAAESLGVRPQDVIGTPMSRWFPPEVTARQQASVERVLATGEPRVIENETPFKQARRWINTSLVPLRDEAGQVASVLGISRDVTESKRMEQALRESEQRYRTVVDTSPDGISVHALDGRFLMANPSVLRMQGYESFEQLLASGRGAFDLVAPEDREAAVEGFRAMLTDHRNVGVTYRCVRADGSTFPAEISAAFLPSVGSEPTAFVGIARDITERHAADAALAAEKEQLAVTLGSIADGVVTTDTEGRVVLLNRVAEQLTGWAQAEASGLPLAQVVCLLDREGRGPGADPVAGVLGSGPSVEHGPRSILVSRDGAERVVTWSAAAIRAATGQARGAALVVHDLTERDKLERELQRIETLESLGILAAGIAHDFNNIMTAILGNISLARVYSSQDERTRERLAEAERALGRARELTRQLLAFAKGAEPVKRKTTLNELIRDTAAFALRGSASALDCRLDPALWPAEVDQGQIAQVISNLVINALQAQPRGGTIELSASNVELPESSPVPLPEGRYVRLTVRDQGVGISPELLTRIFDPYFTTKPRGSGLGLTICHAIVRNHGGHLTAESEEGVGTSFYVYLPATHPTDRPAHAQPRAAQPGSGRVLVVDDDAAIREVSGLMLQFLGYHVVTAGDGEAALAAYRAALEGGARFDAVVLDLTIPGGLGGRETMKKLLELDPRARGIVASGYAEDPVMTDYRKHGFVGAVVKPYHLEEISRILAEATRRAAS